MISWPKEPSITVNQHKKFRSSIRWTQEDEHILHRCAVQNTIANYRIGLQNSGSSTLFICMLECVLLLSVPLKKALNKIPKLILNLVLPDFYWKSSGKNAPLTIQSLVLCMVFKNETLNIISSACLLESAWDCYKVTSCMFSSLW